LRVDIEGDLNCEWVRVSRKTVRFREFGSQAVRDSPTRYLACRQQFRAALQHDARFQRPYRTAAGFALVRLGQLPAVGECFDAQGWRFEVIDLDGRRIDKIVAMRRGRRGAR